jgi:hypothetical protein
VTSYICLRQNESQSNSVSGSLRPGDWHQIGPAVEAISAEAAIRKAVDGDSGGTYVAVPLRSWAPTTVTVETKRTVKIAEAEVAL